MAVIPQVPGISVKVRVAGEDATEYADHQDERAQEGIHVNTCYIEARSGATFSIHAQLTDKCQLGKKGDEIMVRVFVDGAFIRGKWCDIPKPGENPKDTEIKAIKSCCPITGATLAHELKFTTIELAEVDDDHRIVEDKRVIDNLGVIAVSISVAQRGPTVPASYSFKARDQFRIAEKAMKGRSLSHGTSYSEGQVVKAVTTIDAKHETAICRFEFKYRSLKALQDELIIPYEAGQADSGAQLSNDAPRARTESAPDMPHSLKRERDEKAEKLMRGDFKRSKKGRRGSPVEAVDLTEG
ncbi:hypothetical protein HJFPF1_06333 [Paramyrothecium foliicola]|nr:hypothetical protein HJFPF1_06333 [Paramyrothecium foliicola]